MGCGGSTPAGAARKPSVAIDVISSPQNSPRSSRRFSMSQRTLSDEDIDELKECASTLGKDPASDTFLQRTKSIRFVTLINGKVYCLNQNYFNQHSDYNGEYGGYDRYFDLLDEKLVSDGPIARALALFSEEYKLPSGAVVLVQLQTTHWTREDTEKYEMIDKGRTDAPANPKEDNVTGQGIHTDGTERVCIMCIERTEGVRGAYNQLHDAVDGTKPLTKPVILEEGDAVFFMDNDLYHSVSPMSLDEKATDGRRTMLLMHYPAVHLLTGKPHPRNSLGRVESQ